jgi:signal transduction histidine kinase
MTAPLTLALQGAPRGPVRILIAEDDPGSAAVLETLLSRVGYQIEQVGDGAAALRALEQGLIPDLLLLDWMLPEVSGLEVCRRIRTRLDALDLPILMITAKADPESIAAAFEAGATDYLTKPFLAAELRARIAAHLRVRDLIDERRQMDEYLMEREKLSTLGLLVSGVAHDLNNPLAGISGYTQLLLEEEREPEKVTALQRILSEVRRCNRIVSDLLSFARRQPAERMEVEVAGVLRSTLELRERHLASAGIETHVEIPPALPLVWGDPHQLQQVFLNILLNAEQALRAGGSALRVVVEAEDLGGEPCSGAGWLRVTLANDGPPIPAPVLPHIFDPFFTTKGKEGTGLGLAICRRIVTEHGGSIDAETGEWGTRFRILLPAHAHHASVSGSLLGAAAGCRPRTES